MEEKIRLLREVRKRVYDLEWNNFLVDNERKRLYINGWNDAITKVLLEVEAVMFREGRN